MFFPNVINSLQQFCSTSSRNFESSWSNSILVLSINRVLLSSHRFHIFFNAISTSIFWIANVVTQLVRSTRDMINRRVLSIPKLNPAHGIRNQRLTPHQSYFIPNLIPTHSAIIRGQSSTIRWHFKAIRIKHDVQNSILQADTIMNMKVEIEQTPKYLDSLSICMDFPHVQLPSESQHELLVNHSASSCKTKASMSLNIVNL